MLCVCFVFVRVFACIYVCGSLYVSVFGFCLVSPVLFMLAT